MSKEELTALKAYMRIDGDDDDAVIELIALAAVGYLAAAGCGQDVRNTVPDLYQLTMWSLALHWYDHRDDAEAVRAVPEATRMMINQLKTYSQGLI